MKVKGGVFVYAQDVMAIKGVSLRSAWREIRIIKDVFDKKGKQITIFDCAEYWDISVENLVGLLNAIR
ncbi:MAG: hypothetical protein Crog4KO_25900 [Crocinitomicaceae bacterium]